MPRSLPRLLLLLALAPAPAAAHAVLVASEPEAGGTVRAGTVPVLVRFNSRIDTDRSRLTLIGPDRRETVLAIAPESMPGTLHATAALTPGAYVLRWQVLAVDGHITRGDVPFTVRGQ